MKAVLQAKFLVVGKAANDSKDGEKTYYKLAVGQGGEAGSISCTEDVYNTVQEMQHYVFGLEYNDQYKTLRIVGMQIPKDPEGGKPVKSSNGRTD